MPRGNTKKKPARELRPSRHPVMLKPYDLGAHAWFYVDAKSVDLFVNNQRGTISNVRLTAPQLRRMLRHATKPKSKAA